MYLADRIYYRMGASRELANPDQRIAEDIRAFTVTTLSFVLMWLNGSFTIIAFSGVLWSISPLLFIVAVLYAACGSYLTIALGHPLVALNYDQLDKEASFRAGLIHVQENAESIMLAHREGRKTVTLLHRLDELVTNFRKIAAVNRNVTTGYNWLIQIIPALIVAPAFINGTIEFGVITQSAMAFSMLIAAFSLIVIHYQSIASFAAVVARLSSLMDSIEKLQTQTTAGSAIEIIEAEGPLTYEGLTLLASTNGNVLLKDLSISIPFGTRVLVKGSNEAAGVALFRATAGVLIAGGGRIVRPGADNILFLGPAALLAAGHVAADSRTHRARRRNLRRPDLRSASRAELEKILAEANGLDTERDWGTLSMREQQLLAFIHILLAAPRFAFLDRIGTALGAGQVPKILRILSENSITYIKNSEPNASFGLYQAILECGEEGRWTRRQIRPD
jgi:vitamin B12/bleomycin/antimicrobial peptide transport system ATP-binding/permease protein